MKKILFLLGMLAMSAGMFTSCDDEIEEENNGTTDNQSENVIKKQKHLVAISTNSVINQYEKKYASYIYNADGKMADKSNQESYVENTFTSYSKYYPTEGNVFNYSVTGNTSLLMYSTSFNSDGTIVKEEQKLYQEDTLNSGTTFVYNYDADNHLASSFKYDVLTGEKDEGFMCEWTWENGDLISFNRKEIDSHINNVTWSFKYTNDEYPTPIKNETDVLFLCYNNQMIEHCNRYGAVSKHLPVYIINEVTGYGERISWTFDNDGYPTKIELYWADTNGDYQYDKDGHKCFIEAINFVWE